MGIITCHIIIYMECCSSGCINGKLFSKGFACLYFNIKNLGLVYNLLQKRQLPGTVHMASWPLLGILAIVGQASRVPHSTATCARGAFHRCHSKLSISEQRPQ